MSSNLDAASFTGSLPPSSWYSPVNRWYQNCNSELGIDLSALVPLELEKSVVDQRKTKRFELRLPLKVVRHGPRPFSAAGETRNLSSRGVFFEADTKAEVGESIEYVIALPRASESENSIGLHCLGKVLRSFATTGKHDAAHPFSIAATLERYEFVRLKSA